ncbi:histone deacetylase family protein [Meiothermus taiwanensis]|jgi:acetoin utilization deacetylase AcuC-like enzyme|uniref:Acetoin utilization protein AcuC n=2 Tax=Meiothermus taiwanensis TaxID=172827 RepID=A0A399EC79_9DEIN|nr:histone deacetylase [Meiothermus taiwanensis]AWR85855.1 histone deacetylase superfamily [Meiothermus taiwanensis WR-220]KIQ55412.1 deacetylase [Meiothermus taiwanensis]KZK16615.1 deacetylase [Meiothermus taiwanensis]RIH79752.1 Acetoin utilization protein AcuC [Meiothermus taiwanensis]
MRRAYSTAHCTLELPDYHPFPKYKYAGVAEALQDELDVQPAPAIAWETLALAHDEGYLQKLRFDGLNRQEAHKVGLPWSQSLLTRALHAAGGTLAATQDALQTGLGLNLAGGTHHAYPGRAEGYCLFNDVAVAIAYLRAQGWDGRVLIVDLDAHQGNGTAVFFRNDPTVFTLSVHAERNYPLKKEESDLDVGLADATGDAAYLEALKPALERAFAHRPDLVFYNAGVDVLQNDRFGRLGLSLQGLAERDRMVFEKVRQASQPLVVVMGGGYNRDPQVTVAGHAQTYRLALETLENR